MMRRGVKVYLRNLGRKLSKGQGLIETALLVPVLLVILSGLIEFGFLLNSYLTIQDAVRNAARFASDGLYSSRDNDHNCSTTRDFYRQTACLLNQELRQERPVIVMNDNGTPANTADDFLDPFREDDIIISVFSMGNGQGVVHRYPFEGGEAGWSYAQDLPVYGLRNKSSAFNSADVTTRWNFVDNSSGHITPSTGLLLVELYYHYDHLLKLPWITAFVSDPVLLHAYAIMPLVSAEPAPTATLSP